MTASPNRPARRRLTLDQAWFAYMVLAAIALTVATAWIVTGPPREGGNALMPPMAVIWTLAGWVHTGHAYRILRA